MLADHLLNQYVATFFGYGKWEAPIWFIGIEEAGGRTESEIEKRLRLWDSGGRKELEDAPVFYPESGNNLWHGEKAEMQATWKQLIRLLLVIRGKPDSDEAILDYQRNCLGAVDGETCLLELFPLPSPSVDTWNYQPWSRLLWLKDRHAYEQKVLDPRLTVLQKRIGEYRPAKVIFYGDGQLKHWRRIMGPGNYERPILDNLIVHECDGVTFFVTKHPTNPCLGAAAGEYFRQVGSYIHATDVIGERDKDK